MTQVYYINENKELLEKRFQILKAIREFFWSAGFTEVDAPIAVKLPGQEPNIAPVTLNIHDDKKKSYKMYLHTSPEYAMKKMLAAGFDKIFYLGKVFRDYESFGDLHNPEFTMIEWYRKGVDYFQLMEDTEKLSKRIIRNLALRQALLESERPRSRRQGDGSKMLKKWERVTMKELWRKYVKVNLDDYLTKEKMWQLCLEKGYKPKKNESYEELFYRIFLNYVEPRLGRGVPTIVYEYPAPMASLSQLCKQDPRYAERFELYFNGIELANAFSELTNAVEQKKRLLEERKYRREHGLAVYDIDTEFIKALEIGLPKCAGIALGVDRLIMAILGCQNINNVIVLPVSKIV